MDDLWGPLDIKTIGTKKHRKTIGKSGNSWDLWMIYDSVQLVPISPRTLVYDTQITNI